jgi:hypothetical protein
VQGYIPYVGVEFSLFLGPWLDTMKENMPVFTGVGETGDVVDVDEYSRTTRSCHKKLQVKVPILFAVSKFQDPGE